VGQFEIEAYLGPADGGAMDIGTAFIIGLCAVVLVRVLYPSPLRYGRNPWGIKTDLQGRLFFGGIAGTVLIVCIAHAAS
jgi:hypothetical protein